MKRLTFIFLTLLVACSENRDLDGLESQWEVSWEIADETATGDLTLFKNNFATLQVQGGPGSLLVKEPSEVNFLWHLTDNQLTLKRLDNGIELRYNILKRNQDYMELSFADDVKVKLYRY